MMAELLKELLSKSYDVVALDSSENMLAKTKAQLTSSRRRQVEFIETELSQLNKASQFDLVCMNMVLHHMASQEQAFDCVARALKSEGVYFWLICVRTTKNGRSSFAVMCGWDFLLKN